jgi:hypothetical protein
MQLDYQSCNQCGEYRKVTLRKNLEPNLCHNCADKTHSQGSCELCHRDHLPLERHHLAGRKHAPNTVPICLNCHAMLSRRQYEWPNLWLSESCPLFLIWGILDSYVLAFDPTVPFEIFSKHCEEAMFEATRKNVIGPFSIIQFVLLFVFLAWVLKINQHQQ